MLPFLCTCSSCTHQQRGHDSVQRPDFLASSEQLTCSCNVAACLAGALIEDG